MTTPPSNTMLNPDLKRSILSCPSLPSLPAIALEVIEASKDPDIGLAEVSTIIRNDPALSIKLLKIANSPLYSLRRTIHNLREALTLLGLTSTLTISLSFTLLKSLKDNDKSNIDHDNYWKRSLLSATIARHMGLKLGLSNLEDLFLAGLLQDIGILALECSEPEFYSSSENKTHDDRVVYELEKIATDHAQVGAWLLESWNLPEKLVHQITHSHQYTYDEHSNLEENQIHQCLYLSGTIADIWMEENFEEALQQSFEKIQTALEISESEFSEFIEDINQMIPDISNLFEVTISDPVSREQVLDRARELLLEKNLQIIKQSESDRHKIEEMAEKAKDLQEENHRDALTGIYNRRYFEHILEEEFENANLNRWPLSVAFIDIDNFKDVNDSYGHLTGDQVLKEVAEIINQNIRQTDLLARYGGDEFILLLPGSTDEVAKNMLHRILQQLRGANIADLGTLGKKPTVSIGLASHIDKHNFDSITDLLKAADGALYKVKESGRDNISSYE